MGSFQYRDRWQWFCHRQARFAVKTDHTMLHLRITHQEILWDLDRTRRRLKVRYYLTEMIENRYCSDDEIVTVL